MNKPSKVPVVRLVMRVLQGALIGLGAVLPGISGGVLCVIFGIYKPIMELLSNPVRNFKTHVPRLLPVPSRGFERGSVSQAGARHRRGSDRPDQKSGPGRQDPLRPAGCDRHRGQPAAHRLQHRQQKAGQRRTGCGAGCQDGRGAR